MSVSYTHLDVYKRQHMNCTNYDLSAWCNKVSFSLKQTILEWFLLDSKDSFVPNYNGTTFLLLIYCSAAYVLYVRQH